MTNNCGNCKHKEQEGNQWDYYDRCTKHNIVVKGEKSVCRDHEPNAALAIEKKKSTIGYREW
ncbi:MAG: hypothetical protein ACRDDH_11830 [Cetobacterium sp.]|uniref:hypothetical protein n=1 Tax=Cetobacterium sp. TaxID=2071632 RepID=UPI003EE7F742